MPIDSNVVSVSMTTAKPAILCALEARQSVLLIGDPGVGKSALLEQISKARGRKNVVLLGSTIDSTDMSGTPFVNPGGKGKDAYLERHLIPELRLACEEGVDLFLDELAMAASVVQGAMMRTTFNRMCGDRPLHPDTAVVLATNPEEQAPAGVSISAPMMGRVQFMRLRPTNEEVLEFISKLGEDGSLVREEARDFADTCNVMPDLLQIDCPSDAVAGNKPWGAPRAWERAIRTRAAARKMGYDSITVNQVTAGSVGMALSISYAAILDIRAKLPSVQEIANDPDKARIPQDKKQQIGAASLIPRVADVNTHAAWVYTSRLSPEMAAACARILLKRPDSPTSAKWAREGMQARVKVLAAIPKAA